MEWSGMEWSEAGRQARCMQRSSGEKGRTGTGREIDGSVECVRACVRAGSEDSDTILCLVGIAHLHPLSHLPRLPVDVRTAETIHTPKPSRPRDVVMCTPSPSRPSESTRSPSAATVDTDTPSGKQKANKTEYSRRRRAPLTYSRRAQTRTRSPGSCSNRKRQHRETPP